MQSFLKYAFGSHNNFLIEVVAVDIDGGIDIYLPTH